jgi:hypothetical protein
MSTIHYGKFDQYATNIPEKQFTWTDLWTTVRWACPCKLLAAYFSAVGQPPRVHKVINIHAQVYGLPDED